MKHIELKILLLILVVAAAARLIGLGSAPASLYWEEPALGYDAYSIWKTGKDFHGNSWPIIAFESFGDYKASGYFYLAAPFVGLFGLNNWSVRLPSALAGILTVYLVYLIGVELFNDKKVGLWAAFMLAVLPWHIQFSRAAFEVNVATMWLTWGVYLLIKSSKKSVLIVPAGLLFIFSAYTYQSTRLLAPMLAAFVAWLIIGRRLFKSVWFWIALTLGVGLMLPMLLNLKSPMVAERFAETSLFSTSPAVSESNALRAADGNSLLARIIHHRDLIWGKEIIAGMLAHVSPRFLFAEGDGTNRHQTGYTALLYWWCLIPLIAGLLAFNPKTKRSWWILVGWIILSTIPPALTNVTPHTLRFLPAAPAFALLIGLGFAQLFKDKNYLWLKIGLLLFMTVETVAYGFDYATSYQVRSASDWQYGYQQVVQFVNHYSRPQELVQVTRAYGRPSMYFLYYSAYDPRKIQQQAPYVPKDQGELLAFDRYVFGPIDVTKSGMAVSDQPLSTGTLLKTINFPSQKPAFYIYEIK